MPVLKQFLKLYTTISLPKLAALMDTDEAAVKEQLKILEVTAPTTLIALCCCIYHSTLQVGCLYKFSPYQEVYQRCAGDKHWTSQDPSPELIACVPGS